jgi:RND superfamily putative drug exporter
VAVDAVIIRMCIVPSLMMLFGKANWWFPGWLDRILPKLSVDADDLVTPATGGTGPEPELAGAGRP